MPLSILMPVMISPLGAHETRCVCRACSCAAHTKMHV